MRVPGVNSKPFKELCGLIRDDGDYDHFLRTVLAALCNLMLNMYTLIQWHDQPLYVRHPHRTAPPHAHRRMCKRLWVKWRRSRGAAGGGVQGVG
jgi:hypothetical protein